MKLQDALDRFLLQLEADGRSEHTIRQYRRHLRLLATGLAQQGHTCDVRAVDDQDLARFLTSPGATTRPDGRPKKAGSTNALRTSIRCFFGYLDRAGIVDRNPARLIRRAVCSPPPPRSLRPHEEAKLRAVLEAAKGDEGQRDRVLVEFLLATGARLSSALALRVEDLDLEAGIAHLRSVKGGREQVLYLSDKLRDVLTDYIADRRTGAVFAVGGGRHLSTRHIQRRFRQWCDRAGLSRQVTAHSCRHSFAMRIYGSTRDLLVVQAALGHASLASSVVYARVDETRVRQVVAGISSVQ